MNRGHLFALRSLKFPVIERLAWLGLARKKRAASRAFYEDLLCLEEISAPEEAIHYQVGDTEVRLHDPETIRSGGRHVHYAFSTSPSAYDRWVERLSRDHRVQEHDFGSFQSMYCFDPNGHCVEIGSRGEDERLTDIFEVVLEVADLERSEAWYSSVGFETVGRGEKRPRVRMHTDALDLELWEPHVGLAGAKGGVEVDLGFAISTMDELTEMVQPCEIADDRAHVVDPDGHQITLLFEEKSHIN